MENQTNEENFSFIREQIKEKPFGRKRLIKLFLLTIALAIVFGLVASLVFHLMGNAFTKEEEAKPAATFTIPGDDLLGEDDESIAPELNPEASAEDSEMIGDLVTTDDVQSMIEELGPEEYQNLTSKLYAIGEESNKSIATVTGVTSDTDFLNMTYETEGITSGLILGDNGVQKLILTQYSVVKNAKSIRVTFIDKNSYEATLIGYDRTSNLAVIGVELSNLSEGTLAAVSNASLGNSLQVKQGQVVLALGNPTGEVNSILIGTITAKTGELKLDDANYPVFTTDMVGNGDGSGVLINLKGEVIAIYSETLSLPNEENILTAVSLSEVKTLLEKLSNGVTIPYLGIQMTTITHALSEEYNIPEGAYLTSVEVGSPAFEAGLRVGDVITKIGRDDVDTDDDVTDYLLDSDVADHVTFKVQRLGGSEYKELSCTATLQ